MVGPIDSGYSSRFDANQPVEPVVAPELENYKKIDEMSEAIDKILEDDTLSPTEKYEKIRQLLEEAKKVEERTLPFFEEKLKDLQQKMEANPDNADLQHEMDKINYALRQYADSTRGFDEKISAKLSESIDSMNEEIKDMANKRTDRMFGL